MKFRSQVYTSVAGSVGGVTYFNGRFGHLVARARSIPTQPGSTPQTQIRTAWSNAQGLWMNATSAVREAWEDYASTVVYQGPLGSYSINGRERFLATLSLVSYLNTVLGLALPMTAICPKGIGWLLLANLSIEPPGALETGFAVNVDNPNDHDIEVAMCLSRAFPQTINFWKGPWDTPTLDSITVPSLTSAQLVFTGLDADSVYFVRIRGVSDTNEHRISEQFILRAIAELGV